jgi:clan AA aspartic protease
MGMTGVSLTITNPMTGESLRSNFLVDSGASYTALPYRLTKKLKLKPSFEREFSLADGTRIKRQIGNALVEYQGEQVATPVILGEKGDEALLGALTLEALGLVLDPLKRELRQAMLRM